MFCISSLDMRLSDLNYIHIKFRDRLLNFFSVNICFWINAVPVRFESERTAMMHIGFVDA